MRVKRNEIIIISTLIVTTIGVIGTWLALPSCRIEKILRMETVECPNRPVDTEPIRFLHQELDNDKVTRQ